MSTASPETTSGVTQLQELRRLAADIRAALITSDLEISQDVTNELTRLTVSLGRAERTVAEQEQESSRLHALAGVGQMINSSLDLTTVLNGVMDTIVSLTGAERGFLMLRNEDGGLEFRIARNMEREDLEETEFEISRTIVTRVAATGEAVLTTNAQEDPHFSKQASVTAYNLRAILCVPLRVKGAVTGVIYADNRMRAGVFDERDLNILTAFSNQAAVAIENARLFDDLQFSNIELDLAYDATLEGWVRALDLRDEEIEGHSQRVTELTLDLAHALEMSDEELRHVRRGALLHDIGKMGIPDQIMLKPGQLDDNEWEIMRKHPKYAYEMLWPVEYLRPALDIPYCHHEKWDGTGYPRGLRGEEIPFAARIFAVVDVWDALRSDRPYRKAWPTEKVRDYIREQSGVHFDPHLAEVFLRLELDN